MNNISKSVAMNKGTLIMYSDYLLNKCFKFNNDKVTPITYATYATYAKATVPKTIAVFCSVYCDDCNGTCVNSRYSLVNSVKTTKPLNDCSKMCYDNVYNDCICL